MARLVLTDVSPLIGLVRVDGLGWLRSLFRTVEMTRSVYRELAGTGGPEPRIAAAIAEGVAGGQRPRSRGTGAASPPRRR